MKTFEVQGIEIRASFEKIFGYIAAAQNLPKWTSAFKEASPARALLQTPQGAVEVALAVKAERAAGTIDWTMAFPDGNVATAYSRVVSVGENRCIYSFILLAPPVPLEQLEGTLDQQAQTLREELMKLPALLNEH